MSSDMFDSNVPLAALPVLVNVATVPAANVADSVCAVLRYRPVLFSKVPLATLPSLLRVTAVPAANAAVMVCAVFKAR